MGEESIDVRTRGQKLIDELSKLDQSTPCTLGQLVGIMQLFEDHAGSIRVLLEGVTKADRVMRAHHKQLSDLSARQLVAEADIRRLKTIVG